jgi:hypothetical protein
MKKFFVFFTAAFIAASCWAEPVTLEKRSDWNKHRYMSVTGEKILEFRGGRVDIFSTPFVIEPGKKYTFSLEFRSKPGTPAGVIYIGNWSLKGSWRLIPENVLIIKNSDTQILEMPPSAAIPLLLPSPFAGAQKVGSAPGIWLWIPSLTAAICPIKILSRSPRRKLMATA